jgi:hypothetical protein
MNPSLRSTKTKGAEMATSIMVLNVVVAVAAILLTAGFMRLPRTKRN